MDILATFADLCSILSLVITIWAYYQGTKKK